MFALDALQALIQFTYQQNQYNNHGHYILRIFDVSLNFPVIISETKRDYW